MKYKKVELIFRLKSIHNVYFVPYWEYEAHPDYIEVRLKTDYPCKIDEWTTSFKDIEKFYKSVVFSIVHILFIKSYPVTPTFEKEMVKSQIEEFMKNGEIYYIEEGIKKEAIFTPQKEIAEAIKKFVYNLPNLKIFCENEKYMGEEYQSIFTEEEKDILEKRDYLTFYQLHLDNVFNRLKGSNRYFSMYRYITNGFPEEKISIPPKEIPLTSLKSKKEPILKKTKKLFSPYKDNDFDEDA